MKALVLKGVLVLVLPGGLVVGLVWWLRVRWLRRAAARAEALITAPAVRFEKAKPGEVEAMRAAALHRRQAADGKRHEAARIATGQPPVEDRLRIVRGH